MYYNKESEFVMYLDNFLKPKELISLQEHFLTLEYSPVKTPDGIHYGLRHHFSLEELGNINKIIKKYFFPHRNLKPLGISAHLRNNEKEPMFHLDQVKGNVANFLLFVKGDPLFNNGTGFFKDNTLSSHIGFVENRALFFNGAKIWHGDLQHFGDSSMRYTLNIFYREE